MKIWLNSIKEFTSAKKKDDFLMNRFSEAFEIGKLSRIPHACITDVFNESCHWDFTAVCRIGRQKGNNIRFRGIEETRIKLMINQKSFCNRDFASSSSSAREKAAVAAAWKKGLIARRMWSAWSKIKCWTNKPQRNYFCELLIKMPWHGMSSICSSIVFFIHLLFFSPHKWQWGAGKKPKERRWRRKS